MVSSPESIPDLTGRTIAGRSQYYLRRCLGSGGFGAVYLAEQRILGQPVREVAIKVTKATAITKTQVHRIFGEAITLTRLLHETMHTEGRQHLVDIYDMGLLEQHGGRGYIITEYVSGGSLRQRIEDFRSSPKDRPRVPKNLAVEYTRQICSGVVVAHSMNPSIIHCDLKPENVLFERASGLIKVVDFGLASQINDLIGQAEVLGNTPAYAAPEVFLGRSNCASDVYSIGLILYEMLTGIRLFESVGVAEGLSGEFLCQAHLKARQSTRIELPSRFNLEMRSPGDRMDVLVLKCLSNDDSARYPSAIELLADLRRYQARRPLAGPFPSSVPVLSQVLLRDLRQQHLDRARVLMDAGRYVDTAIQLARGLSEYQGEPDSLTVGVKTMLGDARAGAGHYDEAVQSYEQAIRLDDALHVLTKGSRRELYYKAANAHRALGHHDLADSYEKLARRFR